MKTLDRESKSLSPLGSGEQIDSFLAKYEPAVASAARKCRAWMRRRVPGGYEFIYDNYNALVFGFGPSDRPSEAVLSLAVMPRWVTLCFLKGAKLRDPKNLLNGSGKIVRSMHLTSPAHLDDREVGRLISAAIRAAKPSYRVSGGQPVTVIRSISTSQRRRRPAKT